MTSQNVPADFWLDGDAEIRMLRYSYRGRAAPFVSDRGVLFIAFANAVTAVSSAADAITA